jgi:hypothetical protein
LEAQSPPPLAQKEIYRGASAPQINYIAEPWARDTQGCLGTNPQNNDYYSFAMQAEYKYIQCVMKKKGMKTYYNNVLKEENTTLRFRSFTHEDRVQKLVPRMPDNQYLREWELHTLEDMRWNDSYQCTVKYWSRDIINSM